MKRSSDLDRLERISLRIDVVGEQAADRRHGKCAIGYQAVIIDQDNWAQLWTPSEVNGHLFGLSQNGSTQIALDPNGEAGQALKAAGVPLNPSSVLDYLQLLTIADQIQAAGPTLNPQNLAAATHRLPVEGGPTGMAGTWHWGSTHTAIIDSREIYWNGSKPSPATSIRMGLTHWLPLLVAQQHWAESQCSPLVVSQNNVSHLSLQSPVSL